jgi:hypothetical protein
MAKQLDEAAVPICQRAATVRTIVLLAMCLAVLISADRHLRGQSRDARDR